MSIRKELERRLNEEPSYLKKYPKEGKFWILTNQLARGDSYYYIVNKDGELFHHKDQKWRKKSLKELTTYYFRSEKSAREYIKREFGVNENKSDYEVYHKSYSDACGEVIKYAGKNGYFINEDDWFQEVTTAYPGKPRAGKTVKHNVPLYKNGKEQKKQIHFQVYGMETGTYELNVYIR